MSTTHRQTVGLRVMKFKQLLKKHPMFDAHYFQPGNDEHTQ